MFVKLRLGWRSDFRNRYGNLFRIDGSNFYEDITQI